MATMEIAKMTAAKTISPMIPSEVLYSGSVYIASIVSIAIAEKKNNHCHFG